MKKKNTARFVSAFLALCIMIGAAVLPMPVSAASLDDWQQKYSDLEKKNKELQNKINANKNNVAKQKEYAAAMQEQINILEQKVALCAQQMRELDATLEELNRSYDEKYDLFKQRVKANYMSPKTSLLSILLTSESMSAFLSSSEYFLRMTQSDKQLVETLSGQLDEITAQKNQVESSRDQLAEEQDQLNSKKSESLGIIAKINSDNSAMIAEQQKNAKEMAAAAAEIQRIIDSMGSNGDYVGGNMTWPLPGYSYVSSYYGQIRNINGVKDVHTGIDIPAPKGTPIKAANYGTVKYVKFYETVGYGYHLMIDHGGGNYTLYGHCSKILVSEGQKVSKGQTIALVGNTGRSTGPHLHFEVYINQVRTDPQKYVKYGV